MAEKPIRLSPEYDTFAYDNTDEEPSEYKLSRRAKTARRLAAELAGRIRELEAKVKELEHWSQYACETPPAGCDCPGCSLSRESFKEEETEVPHD